MRIEVHTTHHITRQESLKNEVAGWADHGLSRFADRITSLDVHLDDENGPKGGGDDVRCTMEARCAGFQPTAVTARGANVELAARGAVTKMAHALDGLFGRQQSRQQRAVLPDSEELSPTPGPDQT